MSALDIRAPINFRCIIKKTKFSNIQSGSKIYNWMNGSTLLHLAFHQSVSLVSITSIRSPELGIRMKLIENYEVSPKTQI